MQSKALAQYLNDILIQNRIAISDIQKTEIIYGGSVNETYALHTEQEKFFVKLNNKEKFPLMFEKEKEGLYLLNGKSPLIVPQPLVCGHFEDHSFLLMEFIESVSPINSFWDDFGKGLALLHKNTSDNFGLNHDNYNGSLVQVNSVKGSWVDFFIENRLMVQEKFGKDRNLIDEESSKMLQKLYLNLGSLLAEEAPALLHGDLWSGNFMVTKEGKPCIMDPAVYYGNREVDIAMSLLFGGFDKSFYRAYDREFPLIDGWENRVEIYNLYPLLVHVNLFGASYSRRVKTTLKRIIAHL